MSESEFEVGRLFERYRLDAASGAAGGVAHVRMNFVSGADGAVTSGGHSGQLGGPHDRLIMRVLRAMADVVLVSAGTVRSEGYGGLNLPAEFLAWRAEHVSPHPPRIAIATQALGLEPEMSVFRKAEVRPLIVAPRARVREAGDRFDGAADLLGCGETELDLAEVLAELARRGEGRVLCEGGPQLFGSLLERDLVDEVCLTVSPTFTAGRAGRIATSPTEVFRSYALDPPLVDDDGFLFLRYRRR
ncbi:MAG: pyrimidine reductase family protein [Leucobacter sp.]|nr:pyrimidine reductase family protein [Leucobacter sp.]